jgi:hypothetical protein
MPLADPTLARWSFLCTLVLPSGVGPTSSDRRDVILHGRRLVPPIGKERRYFVMSELEMARLTLESEGIPFFTAAIRYEEKHGLLDGTCRWVEKIPDYIALFFWASREKLRVSPASFACQQ